MSPLLAYIPKTPVRDLVSHGPTVQAFVTKTIVNIHKCVCVCVCVYEYRFQGGWDVPKWLSGREMRVNQSQLLA